MLCVTLSILKITMMNKNKIEEASKKCRKDFDECGDRTQGFLVQYGFKEGAKWAIDEFLKDLWHPADEEPKLGKRVLVKINGNLSLFNSGFVVEHLRNFDDHYGIESWLYIDDLFPKEGGKHD